MRFWGKQQSGEAESRRRWRSAEEYNRQFTEGLAEFFAAQPYEVVAENLYGHDIFRLRLAEKIPRRYFRLASRAVRDLQGAFDAAITELTAGSANFDKPVSRFPFSSSAEELERTLDGQLAKLPREIKAFIRSARPFPEGDAVLHALCRLSRIKSRKLLKVGAFINTRLVHEQRSQGMSAAALLSAPTWDEERQEVMMLGEDPQGTLSGRVNVQFFVAFANETALESHSASAVVAHQLAVADELIRLLGSSDRTRLPPRRSTRGAAQPSEDASG